jgi:hypothetical protein
MSETMSWTNLAAESADCAAAAQRVAYRATIWRRWLGSKQLYAMQEAALALGTSPRRIRGLLRGEVFRLAIDEYRRLERGLWRDLDRAAAELRARAAEMEREAEAERLTNLQLTLNLEPRQCSKRSVRTSFCGVRDERWTEAT